MNKRYGNIATGNNGSSRMPYDTDKQTSGPEDYAVFLIKYYYSILKSRVKLQASTLC